MTAENFLSKKLQKFSMVDLAFVKWVYFVVGLLVCALYPKVMILDWVFYLVLTVFCAMPLYIHLFSQPGDLLAKMKAYLKTNNPSNQVLLFFSMFFFALMMATLLPVLASVSWWVYVVLIMVLAIKPLTVTWFW